MLLSTNSTGTGKPSFCVFYDDESGLHNHEEKLPEARF